MRSYEVQYAEAADRDLILLWNYLAGRLRPESADRFVDDVRAECTSLSIAPLRGTLQPNGYRLIGGAKGRVSILFAVVGGQVTILRIRYRGRMN